MALSSLRFDMLFFQPLVFLRDSLKHSSTQCSHVIWTSSPDFCSIDFSRWNNTLPWLQPRIILFSICDNECSWRVPVRYNLPVVLDGPAEVDVSWRTPSRKWSFRKWTESTTSDRREWKSLCETWSCTFGIIAPKSSYWLSWTWLFRFLFSFSDCQPNGCSSRSAAFCLLSLLYFSSYLSTWRSAGLWFLWRRLSIMTHSILFPCFVGSLRKSSFSCTANPLFSTVSILLSSSSIV